MEMRRKNVLVVGMARSGIAVARLLLDRGAQVTITDTKDESAFGAKLDELRTPGVTFALGQETPELLNNMEAVVVSPGVPLTSPLIKAALKRGIPVLGEVELAYRMSQGKIVAITGTNGKTTTTTLVGEIFKNAGKLTHVVGNIGVPLASVATQTHPEDVVVTEISSFQLETIAGFRPTISCVLNIAEDHLDRHGTMGEYVRLKERIFENQRQDDVVVLNFDDEVVRAMGGKSMAKVVYFSRTARPPLGAYIEEDSIVFGGQGMSRVVCKVSEIRIPGPSNLENALAAAAIAMAADVPAPVIRHTLRSFAGVEHRMEFVRELGGVMYYNDSKGTNVHSVLSAIAAMNRPTVIILGGSDKHADFVPLCLAIKDSQFIRSAVLIGQTAKQFADTFENVGFANYHHAGSDMRSAVKMARDMTGPDWNVLLSPACASFDMFVDYEDRGRVFKDIVAQFESAS